MGARSGRAMGEEGERRVRELGLVRWLRDYDEGLRVAKEEEKPVLLLFQEIPGCSTCVGYGQLVLSNATIVKAASTLFVPVAIQNNAGGRDAEVLSQYKEPSWNNPVVRFIDAREQQLAPRLAGDYTVKGLATRMCQALKQCGATVPDDLARLAGGVEAQ